MSLLDFSDAEIRALQEIARRVLGGQINFGRGVSPPDTYEDHQAPEVYIVKSQDDAEIPPRNEDVTGTPPSVRTGGAVCDVYKIVDVGGGTSEIVSVPGLTRYVHNISNLPIQPDYVLAQRDKFGNWIAFPIPSRRRFELLDDLEELGWAEAEWICYVDDVLVDPADTFMVYDRLGIFSGDAGVKGLAEWWPDLAVWEVYQLDCPDEDGTGTGTP